ncbi:MAG: MOSC N-terminal beta barrel domain-containing protein, partial [Janthinobacterium lividum]
MPILTGLHVYPIKSCAGIALSDAQLCLTGLAYDRSWMLVDAAGVMLT